MKATLILFSFVLIHLTSCTSSPTGCGSDQAMNKMMALGSIQSRLVARGGEDGLKLVQFVAAKTASVGDLITQEKYNEACIEADKIAKEMGADLANEQKGMITVEQLAKDGGKGSGTCGIAEASKKQMELHALLQAEIDAGRRDSDIFQQFNADTKGYGEMLATNPSAACKLLDDLKAKYKL